MTATMNNLFSNPKPIVVYTAIIGKRDSLQPIPEQFRDSADWIAFVNYDKTFYDAAAYGGFGWELRMEQVKFMHAEGAELHDPRRRARFHKAMAHSVLHLNTQYSIWIDAHAMLRVDPKEIVKKYLDERNANIATFKHCIRSTVRQEAETVNSLSMDDPEVVNQAVLAYESDGCPADLELAETPVVVRKHNYVVEQFNNLWYLHLRDLSIRDQISFPYCAWKTGVGWTKLDGSRRNSPEFKLKR